MLAWEKICSLTKRATLNTEAELVCRAKLTAQVFRHESVLLQYEKDEEGDKEEDEEADEEEAKKAEDTAT